MTERSKLITISLVWLVGATSVVSFATMAKPRASLINQDPPPVSTKKANADFRAPIADAPRSTGRRTIRPQALDLEVAVTQAELIIAVRLVDMSESKIVHGGKTEVVTQQFKFEPVRTLKGIFARDSLLLTGDDLGIYQFGDAADKLERGQIVLLFLGRQGPGFRNCNTAGTLEQSIPRLKDQSDPLLPAVEALITFSQKRDRVEKVAVLLAALRNASDRDAITLLASLRRRALIAVQMPDSTDVVAKFLNHPSAVVRESAAQTLAAMLNSDYLVQRGLREKVVKALLPALDSQDNDLGARIAELDALGTAGPVALETEAALAWLRADRPANTFVEHATRLRAIGRSGRKDQRQAVASFSDGLPLDAPPDVQLAAAWALGQLDPQEAAKKLTARIIGKSDRGLRIASELSLLRDLPREFAAPALLEAFSRVEDHQDRLAYATACVKIADPRLVPSLSLLLDPRQYDVRWQATDALRKIDTDEAASVLWPHLALENDLNRKLQIAEFLGRHGFRGGYPYAIEHMSYPMLQDAAIEALAAIREPKAVPELRKIWESSNDIGWNSAAIRALGRLGQADVTPRLLELAGDLKNPLAAPALIALGDLGEKKALPLLDAALASRNDAVVAAGIRAARKLLQPPNAGADKTRDRLADLLADPDASQFVRGIALDALVALDDPRLGDALNSAIRDGGLEGTELLGHVETALAKRKQKLAIK